MPRAATHAARATAVPAVRERSARTASPRHRSGRPATAAGAPQRARGRTRATTPSSPRAHGAVVRFPGSAGHLLDHLNPGRAWVVTCAVLLVGIVFLNVSLLELNGGIARTSEQVSELKRANSDLRLEVARLASVERIERRAALQGFYLPKPGEISYLDSNHESDAATAAIALQSAEPEPVAEVAPAAE